MKRFKKLLIALSLAITISQTVPQIIIPVTTVEAHSGRTDSRGGHKDNKNKSGLGSYHYHCGGNPPHLHTDGICPYANGTTSSSSSPSGSSGSSSSTSTANANSISNSSSSNINSGSNSTNNNNNTVTKITISDTSYDNVAFNASYYANKHSDVYEKYGDNAKELYNHFITSGINEGRQSSEQFSIFVYKNNNQDLVDAFGNDLIKYYNHYIEYGVNENRISK